MTIGVGDELLSQGSVNAGAIIREAARLMKGGGGGQPFFAQAGGKDPKGVSAAMDEALRLAKEA